MSHILKKLLPVGLVVAMATPVLLAETVAEADVRVHVGGKVIVRVPHVRVHVRTPRVHVRGARIRVRVGHRHGRAYATPVPRHRLHISGSVYVGGGFAPPPPPPPPNASYDCDVPAYYSRPAPAYYSRPAPPMPVVVAPAPYRRPFGPRLGIGVYAGQVELDGEQGDSVGLIARLRLTRGLSLEGELAESKINNIEARRAGVGLIWDLMPYNKLSPHLIVAGGSWDGNRYGEIGAGLTLRLSPRLHLAADVRAGALDNQDVGASGDRLFSASGDVSGSTEDNLRFTRGRLSALLYF